ncbi:hypothetical protein HNQ93_000776 [Hymenobacter luteus]|uniref:DUF4468 domain-containing protein n=2 Tax=Hymenobacter TaxID=89966 RepID=A0A7W9SXX1_9BACT|nr:MULTISPECIES: DUF4468 domain-containing protein [Hymenobacter]MBB4599744.1 hypothetical protein [Hymenobacter latericoloratus]MBB6057946.1 hypothetical protein [Hymenobacter luteus]
MKKVLLGWLLIGMLALAPEAWAQSDAPTSIEYSERVPAEGAGKMALYRRALDWSQNKFAYKPASGLKTEEGAGAVRITGTSKLKRVDTKGKDQEVAVLFDFVFRANDNGYEYSVNSFRVMPDPKQPTQIISFDEYRSELRAEKSNDRTHNDRRLTAQAVSLASEAAMSFRSYMNSTPAEGHIGVAGGEN